MALGRRRHAAKGGGRHPEGGLDDVNGLRHPNAQPVLFDLDLGQAGLVQEIRQLADEFPVETLLLGRGLGFGHSPFRHGARGATSRAMASRASS